MAKVICPNCKSEVILPEKSTFAMGMTISEESKGTYELPMKRFEKENETMRFENTTNNATVNTNNTNKEMNGMNMNGNFDMEMLAKMVAGMISGQTQTTQNTTENDIQNVSIEKTYNTVADDSKWAKGSKYYGKEICGFIFNPYMIRWHLQKNFEEYMRRYDNNVHYAITREVPYMKSITYTLEEVRKLAMLNKKDRLAYDERRRCFDINSCKKIFTKYVEDVEELIQERIYEETQNTKIGKNVYIQLGRYGWVNVGKCVEVIEKHKVVKGIKDTTDDYNYIIKDLQKLKDSISYAWSYEKLYKLMRDNIKVKVPANTLKAKAFMNVYIKSGAYYTLKQTLMFNENIAFRGLYGRAAIDELRRELNNNYTEGYMIYAMLKEVKKGIR